MKKSKEILQAELIVADLLRNNGNLLKVLEKARELRDNRNFAIAQRVTVTIFLATLWDYYEDFKVEDVKQVYEEYLRYYDSFNKNNENIFKQMLEIDEMLDGDLLNDKMFDLIEVIKEKANEQ